MRASIDISVRVYGRVGLGRRAALFSASAFHPENKAVMPRAPGAAAVYFRHVRDERRWNRPKARDGGMADFQGGVKQILTIPVDFKNPW
ncbi:MAG: hypothetical protein LBQ62_06665 [Candidatus Accumulibacter sp.]|jgi:hypothetical protein|nr:hypothetical protein [Accumulibacter sp.]